MRGYDMPASSLRSAGRFIGYEAENAELVPLATVREVFETNLFGTIALTQAVLPQMRERGAGVIVNVSSSVTLRSLPLLSVYTGTKAAVNAFTPAMKPI